MTPHVVSPPRSAVTYLAGGGHGGQQLPHGAVLHHEGLAAGVSGAAPPPRRAGAGAQGGQVAVLQLGRQPRGLAHHLLQLRPAQGAPAHAPRGLLILLILLPAAG